MGAAFRWLVGSSWLSNLGDGIALAAGPLLIASETQEPLLVALAALLQRLPWLLLVLYAGVLADRLDRRRMVVIANGLRVGVLAALAGALAADAVNVAVVLVAMLALGVAEVFADIAGHTLLPMVIEKADLGIGNARLMAGFLTGNQLVGPALGAALFAAGRAWPFMVQAVLMALAVLLVTRMRVPPLARPDAPAHVWRDVREGFAWLWGNAPVRTLALTIVTFNVTFGAAWSVLVLYADRRLGLGAVGFGLLSTLVAVGGIFGTLAYDRLERRFRLATLMRVGLAIETCTHLGLALTTSAAVAMAIMVVFGAHIFVWGTLSMAVRMRATPAELQGRVGSVYSLGVHGGILVGQAIGGVLASVAGLTAPFWFGFAGSALILALIWRALADVAHVESAR
ncbi:MFS transporter [Solirubrobacter sp. CPCC 204708]|nr:MFS transporter [Solirubrobacter deserti]